MFERCSDLQNEQMSHELTPFLFQEFADSSISILVAMVDESFSSNETSAGVILELSDKCRDVSQSLLNYYVRVEGLKISQVIGNDEL